MLSKITIKKNKNGDHSTVFCSVMFKYILFKQCLYLNNSNFYKCMYLENSYF